MLITKNITAREMLRNYRSVFDSVKRTKQPAIVTARKQPQVAIISMDDLRELERAKYRKSTKALLDMAGIIPKDSGLPIDLSEKHDEYTWE